MTSSASAIALKPSFHVEVRLKTVGGAFVRTDLVFCLSLPHAYLIESINVVDFSGTEGETSFHRLQDVQLDVQAYELHENEEDSSLGTHNMHREGDGEDALPQVRVAALPSKSLNGIWESLVFGDEIPARLLRFTTRMMSIMKNPALNLTILNWNRLILLYGPPGSGKTTLAKALAQKLTIRLGKQFTQGKLIEVNSHSVLSKWFGESSKLVGKMFDSIHVMAEEETTLICVLIDEVETLTSSRERAASGNECGDALRATNQVLTALDRLRHRPNVIVFCTSNLVSTIDSAFLDRVDVKQHISNPCPATAYEILRISLNELIRCNLLVPLSDPDDVDEDSDNAVQLVGDSPSTSPSSGEDWVLMDSRTIPTLLYMNVHLWKRPNCPARKLWRIAQRCDGLSGRTLRRLPFLALALHIHSEACTVREGLVALAMALDEEIGKEDEIKREAREGEETS
ncbi:AAA-domain-containing protein [Glonium stellatum]|uniref:AAA-domain-containing protein n=1 Tax=Glonium stellatum TaxID=574774 RepID=A0A8E2F9L1_9PEZI|nr:AAA-domain-containing protein [Glonium stellatum]